MKNVNNSGEVQGSQSQERVKTLAKHLTVFQSENEVQEKIKDISIVSDDKLKYKESERCYAYYDVKTFDELKEDFREAMQNDTNTEYLAEDFNMSVEDYINDFIENDEERNNEITREHEKVDNFYIKEDSEKSEY